MFNSLNTKLSVTLVLVIVMICSSYGFISYQYILKQQLADKQILNRDLATNLVHQLDWQPGDQLEDRQWTEKLDAFMSINPGIEVYLLDLQGNIKASGVKSTALQRQFIELEPLLQHINGDHMYPLIGQDPLAAELNKAFTVAAIADDRGLKGYLYVVLQSQQQREFEANKRANYYWLISMYILAVSLTIGTIIAVIFFRKFTRRVNRLTHVVRLFRDNEFSNADYHKTLSDDYDKDEIGFLNQSFDSMAQRIQSQIARIKATDENRRNLLAGISHDLRTPLTALRGHLEILSCKTDQLDAQKNKQYLDICIKNAIRIETMIEDVFQLSRLQAREIKLAEEEFSILDLAQDVLFLYRPMAENKGIELELDLNSTQSIPSVRADIGLIERVLENLINNAIKHTNKGKVKVLIHQENQRVKISIIDNGKGIEPEDQAMIFHPYYQVEAGSTLENKGGLGLAICDKILTLHQQKLSLISEPGKGSCFSFYLAST